jgi:hypothetical protein
MAIFSAYILNKVKIKEKLIYFVVEMPEQITLQNVGINVIEKQNSFLEPEKIIRYFYRLWFLAS